jgi:organic radical activating enzyme
MKSSEIFWNITKYCSYGCAYCEFRNGSKQDTKNIEDYLRVINKIQTVRYRDFDSLVWKISGGEVLSIGGTVTLANAIKSKPSRLEIETSGGDSWFEFMPVLELVDRVRLTVHDWQNQSVTDYIIDMCQTNNIDLVVSVPLPPGKIKETRERIEYIKNQGVAVKEQLLYNFGRHDQGLWTGYAKSDIIEILGYEPEEQLQEPPPWVNPSSDDGSPSFTGKSCSAGIDYLRIDHAGFSTGSFCGDRPSGNVFDLEWEPPSSLHTCGMIWCKNQQDRSKLRIDK